MTISEEEARQGDVEALYTTIGHAEAAIRSAQNLTAHLRARLAFNSKYLWPKDTELLEVLERDLHTYYSGISNK